MSQCNGLSLQPEADALLLTLEVDAVEAKTRMHESTKQRSLGLMMRVKLKNLNAHRTQIQIPP